MGVETANIVLVVIIVIIFFMLMSACCRQLRSAYDEQLTIQDLDNRRRAFILGGDNLSSEDVRVATFASGGGDRVFGVYEIRMPRRGRGFFSRAVQPPPPFQTALQNSSPIFYIDPAEPPPSYEEYMKASLPPPPPSPIPSLQAQSHQTQEHSVVSIQENNNTSNATSASGDKY